MRRRRFLQLAATAPALAASAARPNVVLVVADDMGYSDVGCHGAEIPTPNIDALAREGVRLTHFYNAARCCPSRAALLTGLYPHQAGIGHMVTDLHRPGYRGTIGQTSVTIAEALGRGGYGCYLAGKWHVTHTSEASREHWPLQRGFHQFYGTLAGGGHYFYPNFLVSGNDLVRPPDEDYYYTDAITDHAIRFIVRHPRERPGQPFFLCAAYTSPHWPLHALEPDIRRFEDLYRAGWDDLRLARHRRQKDLGIVDGRWPLAARDGRVPAWKDAPDKEWEARRMAVYAAQVVRMDHGVGRIREAVRRAGVERDTLFLFLSDNGASQELLQGVPSGSYRASFPIRGGNRPEIRPGARNTYQSYGIGWAQLSNTPFRGYKAGLEEGGIATPLIAAWGSGLPNRGSTRAEVSHVIDLLPTCLDAAGLAYPTAFAGNPLVPLAGRSLLPALRGRTAGRERALFWEHQGHRAVRKGRWKLRAEHLGAWALHDMDADRTETTDLAGRRPDLVGKLAAEYEGWVRRSDVLPWDEVRPRAAVTG